MKNKLIYFGIIALILASALLNYYTPKPLDFAPTFYRGDKRPLGNYMIYEYARQNFIGGIRTIDSSLYQSLNDTDEDLSCYISISRFWQADSLSLTKLLNFVNKGNCAFISAQSFKRKLLDTLKLGYQDYSLFFTDTSKQYANFVNPYLRGRYNYTFFSGEKSYFNKFDSSTTSILGKYYSGEINFVACKFGKGYFFLSLSPHAFTNYSISSTNFDYSSRALSYIPLESRIIWDDYFTEHSRGKGSSAMREILTKPPLKAAYQIIIIGIILLMLFKIKRTQRIIPIVQPFKNNTLEFAAIIANLHFQSKDNLSIAKKRLKYLSEFLRAKYKVLNENEILINSKNLSERTGVDIELAKSLIETIETVRYAKRITDSQLLALSQNIDNFYLKVNNGKYE